MDAVTFEDVLMFVGYLMGIGGGCLALSIVIGACIHFGTRD